MASFNNHAIVQNQTGVQNINGNVYFSNPPIDVDTAADEFMTALWNANPTLTHPVEDRRRIIDKKGVRTPETCTWILNDMTYQSWSPSQPLWISGGPGKGKTMLAMFLAERYEEFAQRAPNTSFTEFYCDSQDDRRNTAMSILRSLIFQLIKQSAVLSRHFVPAFKVQSTGLFAENNFESLWTCFENMLRGSTQSSYYLILDGLDECDHTSMRTLLRRLMTLFSPSQPSLLLTIHLIVLSREHPDTIAKELKLATQIRLDQDKTICVHRDLEIFIADRVEFLSENGAYPDRLRSHVESVFRQRSQNTFLWVGMVAKELEDCSCDEVIETLECFPSGLDALYARMLKQIPQKRRNISKKLLTKVALTYRSLTLEELGAFVENTVDNTAGLDITQITRTQVMNCGQILLILKEGRNEFVTLIHQSAKDFLLGLHGDRDETLNLFAFDRQAENLSITQRCMDLLLNYYQSDQACYYGSLLFRGGFGKPEVYYCLNYWVQHARQLTEQSWNLAISSSPFLSEDNKSVRQRYLEDWQLSSKFCPGEAVGELFLLACALECNSLVRCLMRRYNDSEWPQCRSSGLERSKQEMLSLALCYSMSLATTKLLLESGADPNFGHAEMKSPPRTVWDLIVEPITPLLRAVYNRDIKSIQLLINAGAYIDTFGAAMHAAVTNGHVDVVQVLLQNGVNPNDTPYFETYLDIAIRCEDDRLIYLLLEYGALTTRQLQATEHGLQA